MAAANADEWRKEAENARPSSEAFQDRQTWHRDADRGCGGRKMQVHFPDNLEVETRWQKAFYDTDLVCDPQPQLRTLRRLSGHLVARRE